MLLHYGCRGGGVYKIVPNYMYRTGETHREHGEGAAPLWIDQSTMLVGGGLYKIVPNHTYGTGETQRRCSSIMD